MSHRYTLFVGLLLAGSLFVLPTLAPPALAGKYAVLVSGMEPGAVPSGNTLSFLYKTLITNYGYAKKDIYVLYHTNEWYDLDGDGQNDVDYSATRANLFAVFDTLDFNRNVGANDVVFVYTGDHGSRLDCWASGTDSGDGELCLYYWDPFRTSEMDSVFLNLEDGDLVDNWPKILGVFDQCYGGAFVEGMNPYAKRAVCSASSAKQPSWYHYDGRPNAQWPSQNYVAFTYHWICAMAGHDPEGNLVNADANGDGKVSFYEAYKYAKANDEYTVNGSETPQYWDLWDGFGLATALDGTTIPVLIAKINREYPIHNPGVWGDGGAGGWLGSGIAYIPPGPEPARATSAQAGAGTRQLYARVHNTGSVPVTSMLARFSYGLPSTIASSADTSLHYIGSASISMLMPGDTARIGPVIFVDPGLNPFGQPYWKVFATVESPQIPPETGWVDDDFHVAIENSYTGTSTAGEPVELGYRVTNPQTAPKKIVLSMARNTLPTGWTVESTPALGETLVVGPGVSFPALLRIHPDGIHGPGGIVTLEERLHDPYAGCWAHCRGKDSPDSTFISEGGFIRTTGGISFKVAAPYTGAVPETPMGLQVSLAYPNPTAGSATLTYSLPFRSPVRVMVYDIAGRCLQRTDLGEQGSGAHSFIWNGRDERGKPVPTGTYVLSLQIRGHVEDRRVVVLR
jgi:hypothetical protein